MESTIISLTRLASSTAFNGFDPHLAFASFNNSIFVTIPNRSSQLFHQDN
jgi:hypothetical protein